MTQIEDNEGATIVSEGLDANYSDIVNYALFALIRKALLILRALICSC